jgi:hypothetical protein
MLYKHQSDIINEDKPKTGLFLGTGSGKTLIALLLARGNTLIICPKTQHEDRNWHREVEKNNLKLNITTISKETFRRDYLKLPAYDTVIVDECHTVLGVTPNIRWVKKQSRPRASQLYEALKEYLQKTKPKRFYLATATIMRSPMTVWGASQLLGYNFNFYEWRNTFYKQLPMPGRDVWIPRTDDATKERLANVVRKMGYVGRLEDFFDVPDQTHKVIHIELTDKQKKRIKEIPMEYPDPIVQIGKKHQIENGGLTGDEYSDPEFFDNGKIDILEDLAIEFPKMVVFAKYKAQIAQIATKLKTNGHKVITLTGETKDRGNAILEANNSKECVFIAQAQISAGWELPSFPVMVFASRTYSFVDLDQSLGRIQRANNIKKNLYIYLVVKGGVDEAVHKCLEMKKDFNEKLYVTSGK